MTEPIPIDQIVTALDDALALMAPEDRAYAIRQHLDDMRAVFERLDAMPADKRRTLMNRVAAECDLAAADIAKAGPDELRRFAQESAHALRVRGEHHPALNDDETARVEAALEAGRRYRKAFRACRHVLAGGPVIARGGAILCISHPQHGVRCQDCHNTHVLAHDPIGERTCDNCGAVAAQIYPVICFGPTAFRVALPKKRSRWVPALLTVLGTGYCEPCKHERADQIPDLVQVAPRPTRTR